MSTRRSTRLASRASSRASSVAADDTTNNNTELRKEPDFDPNAIVDALMRTGDISIIEPKLTKPRLIQVIDSLTSRAREQARDLESKAEKIEDLEYNLLQTENSLTKARDPSRGWRIGEYARKAAKDTAAEQTLKQPEEMDVDAEEAISSAEEIQSPPEASPVAENHPAPPETPAQKSYLTRFFAPLAHFWSPTPAKTQQPAPQPLQPQQQQPSQPQQPLGKLPNNRKRSAPTPEVTEPAQPTAPAFTTPTPKTTYNAPPRANTPFNSAIPDALEPITEQMEHSEASILRPQTKTPARRRGIQEVRSQRAQKQAQIDMTPPRAWEHPPNPRLPNADERMRKLNKLRDHEQKLKVMREELEHDDILPPAKRVRRIKVDEVAKIPHRAPGDPSSTFRVPDIDSDDEMEVDEDVEMLPNVFEASQAEEAQREREQQPDWKGKQPVRDAFSETSRTFEPAYETETTVTDTWAFPTVGTRADDEPELVYDPFLAKKFDFGFESWKRGLDIVEW